MGCLSNLNPFSEESIDVNTPCSIKNIRNCRINRIFTLRTKKILCEKLCAVINTGTEWIYILTRKKITSVQDVANIA